MTLNGTSIKSARFRRPGYPACFTWLVLVAGATWNGCAARAPKTAPHENLHSTLWVQDSAEFAALSRQSYRQAQDMLDQALADKNWTAATEQTGSFQALPPAVVLDIDETVLDNSVYQARLIANSEVYDEATWQLWCREASATAVPGALGFTRYAEAHGVTVFYVTNRRSAVEAPTRQNLEKLGFPLSSTPDTLYTRGEKEEWASSNKTPRRQEIASHYRILLMLGDNLEDFVHTDRSSSMARKQIVTQYDAWWGTRWIVFANPQYGSWEGALFDFDFSLSESEKLKRKRDKLETK